MALWLFRRKSRRKRSRTNSPMRDIGAPPRSFTVPGGMAATAAISSSPIRRRPSSRKQRHEPNKLQRRARTYSFESGRADDLEMGSAGAWKSAGRRTTKRSTPSPPHASGPLDGSFSDNSRAAPPLDRIPTLHHSSSKRDGRHLLSRTKSSKRRKNAHNREREAEIKAMSNPTILNDGNDFTPVRPAAEHWTAGRPMKRETIKGHHNSFTARYARDKEKQPSDVSLPMAGSIDSAMSSDSEQVAYGISPFAAFAPKPTLRYTSQPRIGPPSGGSFPNRNASQKGKLALPIPEATLKAHKRVDDLANDMNASDLRELMERDSRRRDRRRVHDEETAARRLAKQADRQHNQQRLDAQASSSGQAIPTPPRMSPDMARGVLGREAVGLGIGTTSAIMTSATRRESPSLPTPPQRNSIEFEERQQRDIDDPLQPPLGGYFASSVADVNEDVEMSGANHDSASSSRRRASPVDMYHRPDSIPIAPADLKLPAPLPQAVDIREEPSSIPARTPSKLRKLAKLRKRLSNSSSLKEEQHSVGKTNAAITRKASHSGSSRGRGSLSWGSLGALFRWRTRSKRGSGPSSFSNLSRDSMAAQSSIQRSQHHFEASSHGQLRNRSQTLVEEPAAIAASASSAAAAGPVASIASIRSTVNATRPANAHPLKAKGIVPKRTLSRFKEDLPDFLMSPPASRVQSPEGEPMPTQQFQRNIYRAAPTHGTSFINDDGGDDESIIITPTGLHQLQQQQSSYDSNSMGNSMTNGTRDTPTSWLHMDETEPSPEPQQSLSLASIDSEGSWLSGRAAARRRATQPQPSLDNVSRSFQDQKQQQKPRHHHSHGQSWASDGTDSTNGQQPTSPTEAELFSAAQTTTAAPGVHPADEDESSIVLSDEYLSRLARNSTGGGSRLNMNRESAGDMLPSSDDEIDTVNGDADARWGSVNEKRVGAVMPTHRANLVKSREGLMKTFYDGEEGSDRVNSPISPVSMTSPTSQASSEFKDEEAGLQRATSVNLRRGHVRRISAGSAKLLEITPSPRNSVDAKAARSREPLF